MDCAARRSANMLCICAPLYSERAFSCRSVTMTKMMRAVRCATGIDRSRVSRSTMPRQSIARASMRSEPTKSQSEAATDRVERMVDMLAEVVLQS